MSKNLKKYRVQLDKLDLQLVTLLNKRAAIAAKIGEEKAKTLSEVFLPQRETELFKKILEHNQGIMPKDSLKTIYLQIVSACRNIQGAKLVAVLGKANEYTQRAACERFGLLTNFSYFTSVRKYFSCLANDLYCIGVFSFKQAPKSALRLFFEFVHLEEYYVIESFKSRDSDIYYALSRTPLPENTANTNSILFCKTNNSQDSLKILFLFDREKIKIVDYQETEYRNKPWKSIFAINCETPSLPDKLLNELNRICLSVKQAGSFPFFET